MCQVIIQSTGNAGDIKLKASSLGLADTAVLIKTTKQQAKQ
jgi:hypothetical protein